MTDRHQWVHHFADFRSGRPRRVQASATNRPLELRSRLVDLGVLQDLAARWGAFAPPAERRLSPRRPYLDSPRSFLVAAGDRWSVDTHTDELRWSRSSGTPFAYFTVVFDDVAPGTVALLSLTLQVTRSEGQFGRIKIQTWDAVPQTFEGLISGAHVFDIVVRVDENVDHDDAVKIIVSWQRTYVDAVCFTEITYRTV